MRYGSARPSWDRAGSGRTRSQACVLRAGGRGPPHRRRSRCQRPQPSQRARGAVPGARGGAGPEHLVLVSGGFTSALTGRFPVGPQLRRIANAAAAASVNIYTVYFSRRFAAMDTSRARENATPEEDRHLLSAGLGQLTGMAGGALFEAVGGGALRVRAGRDGDVRSLSPQPRAGPARPRRQAARHRGQGVAPRRRRAVPPPVRRARGRGAGQADSEGGTQTGVPTAGRDERAARGRRRAGQGGDGGAGRRLQGRPGSTSRCSTPGAASWARWMRSASGASAPVRHQETLLLPRGVYIGKANVVDAAGRTRRRSSSP